MRSASLLLILGLALSLASCSKKVSTTSVHVEDSVRHYYPIVAGEELKLEYTLTNTGKEPLVIDDIQPSCGCILGDVSKKFVPPGADVVLPFTFTSNKNIGYVRHTIRLFCNVRPRGVINLVFDVNIVPPADYTRDYEEVYNEQKQEESAGADELVNGKASEKGYYVDIDKDARSGEKYPWRE